MAIRMILASILSAYIVVWLVFNIYNLYPLFIFRIKNKRAGRKAVSFKEYRSRPERSFPKISLLIPAYREAVVLRDCIKGACEAEYPRNKLEIIVLTEKGDTDTISVANEAKREFGIKHIQIETTDEPRGKPRALNQALRGVDSDIIGVLDAEDVIEPLLFKKAAYKIQIGNYDAVQGILDMVNEDDGLKNLHFRAEYGYWFRMYLPALESAGYPIPLGGTSNFIRTKVLKEIGGWDSYNLTEDFELGLRLYNNNKSVGLDDSIETTTRAKDLSLLQNKYEYNVSAMKTVTKEESPLYVKSWIRQRTRWQRGKIQTLRGMYANPPENRLKRLHSTIMSFIPHVSVISFTGVILSVYVFASGIPLPYPILIFSYADLLCVGVYSAMQGMGYLKSIRGRRSRFRKLKALFIAMTTPLYWILLYIADIRALKQEYVDKAIFWEKTEHFGRNKPEVNAK